MRACAALLLATAVAARSTIRPEVWTQGARAEASTPLKLVIGLKQTEAGRADLLAKFWAVSDPASASFGKFLSKAEVDALAAPTHASVVATRSWLASAGISQFEFTASNGA